jgi:hypothetical protein
MASMAAIAHPDDAIEHDAIKQNRIVLSSFYFGA